MPPKKEKAAISQPPPTTKKRLAKSAAKTPEITKIDSKLKPSLVEPIRFSARREKKKDGGAIGRIIVYVVIVILVGVGLSLLVQSYISNQSADSEAETVIIDAPDLGANPVVASADIGSTILPDSDAGDIADNELFTSNDLSLGSSANDTTDVKVNKLTHEIFTSFTRTSWELSGVSTGLPATTITYNRISNEIVIAFDGIDVVEQELLQRFSTEIGNVTSITGKKTDTGIEFLLILETSSKYNAYVQGADTLVLETKTDTQLTEPSPETEVVKEEVATPEETIPEVVPEEEIPAPVVGMPESPNFDNEFSQDMQYIVNDSVTGKSVFFDTYYYQDDATSFLFSWAMRNTGDASIPNATAELITDSGKDYIEVTINNLGRDLLQEIGKDEATIVISTAGTPLVKVIRKSTVNGTSVYWIELTKKTDFKLYSTITEGTYQLLTLEIAD